MNTPKPLLAVVIAIAAFVSFTSTASAANLCVGASPSCTDSPAPPYAQSSGGINAAISAASLAPGSDVVHIAAGSYGINAGTFPTLPSSADDLAIVGAGVGQTILSSNIASGPLIDLQLGKLTDTFSGFTLNATFTGNYATAIILARGRLNNFAMNQTGTVTNGSPAFALDMRPGTQAIDGAVTSSGNASGVTFFNTSGATIRRVNFTGDGTGTGAYIAGGGDAEVLNSRFVGYSSGVRLAAGALELTDSLIDMQAGGASAIGLYIEDQNVATPTSIYVLAARNTIVGSGAATGVYMNTQEAVDSTTGSLKDMLIYGSDPSFTSWVCSGTAGSTMAFSVSGLATNVAPSFGGGCDETVEAPSTLTLASSPFVNFATGDLRPAWDSDLVDAGGSTSQSGGNDLAGGTRLIDGDNDGSVLVDIGAFEYQAAPPAGAVSAPASATAGQSVSFSHSMTEPDPTNSLTGVLWNFGDGSTSTLSAPTHAYAAAGSYTVTLAATNGAGSVGTATASIVVTAAAITLPLTPPSAKITAKPKKSFAIGKKGVVLAKKGATSFRVAFAQSTKAKFSLKAIGKGKKLKTLKGSQTLKLPAAAALVKFSFGGTWNKKKLAAGSYRLSITPLGADGSAGKPVTVDLKLKK